MPAGARFLILIVVVAAVGILIGNLYLLVFYAHPEDRNQAWLPKVVVVLGSGRSRMTAALCARSSAKCGRAPATATWCVCSAPVGSACSSS